MNAALLVIDLQKAFFLHSPETAHSMNQAIVVTNAAIEFFRQKNLPVICIQHINPANGVTPDSEGFALPEHLNVQPEDLHIHKTYGNAFNKTTLLEELRRQNIDTLILTGYCAEYCVLSTYRGALDLDLTPILLRGAIASRAPQNIPFVENVNDIISLGALKHLLR
jgi:nicotinamidase-related amidase